MTKEQCLQLIKLLSALESWGFSTGTRFPDYLLDELNRLIRLLEKEVLK